MDHSKKSARKADTCHPECTGHRRVTAPTMRPLLRKLFTAFTRPILGRANPGPAGLGLPAKSAFPAPGDKGAVAGNAGKSGKMGAQLSERL